MSLFREEILISNFLPCDAGAGAVAVSASGGIAWYWWLLIIAAVLFMVYLLTRPRNNPTL